jgi:hypothetical protein
METRIAEEWERLLTADESEAALATEDLWYCVRMLVDRAEFRFLSLWEQSLDDVWALDLLVSYCSALKPILAALSAVGSTPQAPP